MKPLEEIRAAADIVKVVGAYVKLRKAGANFVGLCPFHQEKTASFAVHPTKQIFHCFGCGAGGDVFKFVMLIDNVTFPEAVERVAESAGVRLPEHWSRGSGDPNAKLRSLLHAMHETAAKYYAAQLGATAEGRAALAYLEERGLSGEAIAHFRIGYAPAEGCVLARHLAESGFSAGQMESAGIVVPGRDGRRPLDRFRRRVIFPIVGESGKVVAFAGRALGDDQPKYLNSPETPIYTKGRTLYHLRAAAPEIRKQDCAVLVEGYMDCIAAASAGVAHVVASCGTSLTVSQIRLLARSTRRIVVNFDPDSAGVAATERSLGLLLEEGFEIKVLSLPGGLDPDSYVRKHGGDAYKRLLDSAPSYLDYLIERALASEPAGTPEGKIRAANAVLPYIAKVPGALLRDEMAVRLAERLRVDEALLRTELKRAAQQGSPAIEVRTESPGISAGMAEKDLLRAFMSDPALAAEFLGPVLEEGLADGLRTAALFKKIFAEYARAGTVEMHELEASLTEDESSFLYGLLCGAGASPARERVSACVQALKRRNLEQQQRELQARIERAAKAGDAETVRRLLKEKHEARLELTRSLAVPRQG